MFNWACSGCYIIFCSLPFYRLGEACGGFDLVTVTDAAANTEQTLFLSQCDFWFVNSTARDFDATYNSYKLHDFVYSVGKMSCIFEFNMKSLQSKSFIRCLYSEAIFVHPTANSWRFSQCWNIISKMHTRSSLMFLYLYLTQRIRWIFMLNSMRTISELFFSHMAVVLLLRKRTQ